MDIYALMISRVNESNSPNVLQVWLTLKMLNLKIFISFE